MIFINFYNHPGKQLVRSFQNFSQDLTQCIAEFSAFGLQKIKQICKEFHSP